MWTVAVRCVVGCSVERLCASAVYSVAEGQCSVYYSFSWLVLVVILIVLVAAL
jgi:hypothetical protein